MWKRVSRWAREIKRDVLALYLAARDPRTPLVAKLVGAAVVAYAFSPIDLIPDVIPVIGYLDDALIVPLGLLLAIRLIPPEVMRDCRAQAAEWEGKPPVSRAGAAAVIVVWVAAAALALYALGVFAE